MKGIVLAGGTGSRLWPMTKSVCKQLLPIYNKPMVYYPLATLMEAGIREVLIITTPNDRGLFENLLGNGDQWGMKICYQMQSKPSGIAESLIIGEKFLDGDHCALILGDNLFFGQNLRNQLLTAAGVELGATILVSSVVRPESYGVVEFNKQGNLTGIVEKPKVAPSNLAVTGLYFYDGKASGIAKSLIPSGRGELEITDVNNEYIRLGLMNMVLLDRGTAWLDTGTPNDLLEASHFVKVIESRQGVMVGCPEEMAFVNGWINSSQLSELAVKLGSVDYGRYLLKLAGQRP